VNRKEKRRFFTIERSGALAGYLFILPFVIGFILFFLVPLAQSLQNSVSLVEMNRTGRTLTFVGWQHYADLIFKNSLYLPMLAAYFQTMGYELVFILIFSLFIALLLQQKFKGRTLARAVFFLPVIVSSGIVINILGNDLSNQAMRESTNIFISNNRVITDLLLEAQLGLPMIDSLLAVIGTIFDLTWKSGVQILLFLAALHAIPTSFYEASEIEGASGWVSFWKITFPMISPYILVCFVVTVVESFSDYNNPLINAIYTEIRAMNYGPGSAMAWGYTVSVFVALGIVLGITSRRVFYMVE
jgi:ABC-type sugar transport system permease subunit